MSKYQTTYGTSDGREYPAYQIPWSDVTEILGHKHDGYPEDDQALIAYLLEGGAPEWVSDAEGWTDEYGWGIYKMERVVSPADLLTLAEIAGEEGVTLATARSWPVRNHLGSAHPFPAPWRKGRTGEPDLYLRADIVGWLTRTGRISAETLPD